jgi:hypothetical protein
MRLYNTLILRTFLEAYYPKLRNQCGRKKQVVGQSDKRGVSGHYRTERGSAGSYSQVRIIMIRLDSLLYLKLTLGSGATALGSVKQRQR